MFRWLALIIFVATLSISAQKRWRAHRGAGAISRSAESLALIAARIAVALPLFGSIVAYLANPGWMAWASLGLPLWARWLGVGLGLAVIPSVYWTLSTLGDNVSETVLTKPAHHLVTTGPYQWVRHPLYASGIALFLAMGLIASNWFILACMMIAAVGIRSVIIPREETNLLARFGGTYGRYANQTGSLLPRIAHSSHSKTTVD